MRGRPDAERIERAVVERLEACLGPEGWLQRSFTSDDGVTFVREPVNGVVWLFSVNLGGHRGMWLSSSVGVEHAEVAEEQRRLFGRKGTVCQIGASMINLVYAAEPSRPMPTWWVESLDDVDGAVAQAFSDLKIYGEPFLRSNLTLPQLMATLNHSPKSQPEYSTLAVCYAMLDDLPRARGMLAKFGTEHRVFAGGMTETFMRNFTERFDPPQEMPRRTVDGAE